MAIGNHNGVGQAPAGFGYQPSGVKIPIARVGQATLPSNATRRSSGSKATLGGVLPSPATLDYAHKLTSTTILLLGAAAFLVLGPRTLRGKLSSLSRKHVGGS